MAESKAQLALLGIGALGILYYLFQSSSAPSASAQPTVADDTGSAAPTYPNQPTIQLGNITIGGSPTYLQTTQLPITDDGNGGLSNPNLISPNPIINPPIGDGGGCCNDCPDTSALVSTPTIPMEVLTAAVNNFASAPAAQRLTLTAAAPAGYAVPEGEVSFG